MATQYHIDNNGKVVPCKAFIRKCPLKDYETEEAAYTALFIQKEVNRVEEARLNVKAAFDNPNAKKSFIRTDFSGMNDRKNIRTYVNSLDREFYATSEEPDFYYVRSPLAQNDVTYTRESTRLYINRIPTADYDDGVITSRWTLTLETPATNRTREFKETIELDLNNNFDKELQKAEKVIRENILQNADRTTTRDSIIKQTEFLKEQIKLAYFSTEEEAGSLVDLWEKYPNHGTFQRSDPQNLVVNANYKHSGFRGRMFERFVNENPYYQAMKPELNIRVYNMDSDTGNLWSIRRFNDKWYFETRINGEKSQFSPVESADEGYEKAKTFIINNVPSETEESAHEKSVYVSDLITDIDMCMSNLEKRQKLAKEQEKAQKHQNNSRNALFGNNKTSTSDKIVDLFV